MSAEPAADSDRSPRAALLEALDVHRAVRRALVVGAVVAVLVPLVFLVGVAGGRTDEPIWFYPSLAFVVFATTAMLAAAVLVGRRVLRLAVHPAALVRRSATVGLLAGALWLVAAVGLAAGPGRPWSTLADVALPWAALLTPLGLWAVYTRHKRTATAPRLLAIAVVIASLAALVLADLAAFELVAILPDVGEGTDPSLYGLFDTAAATLVAGQAVVAGVVGRVRRPPQVIFVPVMLSFPPLIAYSVATLLGPSRVGLVVLAAGQGLGWVAACWFLRRVTDAAVPTGPDPWPAED